MKPDSRPWMRLSHRYIALFFLSCALGFTALGCQIAYANKDIKRCSALLHHTVQAYESAKRLQADFFLDSGFLSGGPSSGTISLERPCCLRVSFNTPEKKVFLLNKEAQYEYYPNANKTYRYRADSDFRPSQAYELFLNMRQYLAYVQPVSMEELNGGLQRLRLVPVSAIPQISEIQLDIEESSGFLRRAVVLDADGGELVRIRLDGYTMLEEWAARFFEPPTDARIYTPMVERDFLNSDR